jgi:putative ABC transport system permease protein
MMVTSMAALGAVGGLIGIPIGIGVHRLVLPAMAHAAQVAFTDAMINIYRPALLAALALAGIAIAALGAYLPARSAGRLTIAEVLHNE